MESDVLTPSTGAGLVEETAAAVGETEFAQGDDLAFLENPWSYLEDYFVLKSRDKTNVNLLNFRCVICRPKETIIKGHASTLCNLKSHVKRIHPGHVVQFEEKIKTASLWRKKRRSLFRGSASSTLAMMLIPPKKICLPTTGEASGDSDQSAAGTNFRQSVVDTIMKIHLPTTGEASGDSGQSAADTNVSQSVVDTKIVDLFVCNMLPLHIVESPTFVSLITTLNPSKTSMSRSTLAERISASHEQLQDYLIRLLNDVPWVATTADCWSVHNRSYLGITAYWLHPKTCTRQHAVLACKRLKRHHNSNDLAEAIMDTLHKFCVEEKVSRITTDNGGNFVKGFVQFGTDADLMPDIPAEPDVQIIEDVDMDVDPEVGYVDQVEYISVNAALDESSGLGLNLPLHMRCAAHTFNLIASVDAAMVPDSASFKSTYRKAMSKAQAMWDVQSRSTMAADSTLDELRLVVPNSTRWYSTCHSLDVLNSLLKRRREAVHKVMTQLKLQTFTDSEVSFLKEYAMVMSIVAKALDKIQDVNLAYLGSLLPTVVATIMKLKEAKSKNLLYCSPLVDALLAGITKRFGLLLDDLECQLAAAFHPKFRLFWLEQYDKSQHSKVKKAMECAVEAAMVETSDYEEVSSTSSNEGEEDDFFSAITQYRESRRHRSLKSKAQTLVRTWLEADSTEFPTAVAFFGEQVLIDLFIKYNTTIPSSAAVERLFFTTENILRDKTATMSDGKYEELMFIRGNQHHITEMEKPQSE